ncbi:MAG: hypothetical protein MUO82_01350, partial [Candidatus Thermoplasmatota archaeon]|nr:hypothetical protein [Candidatus Thermoplasmatota archaeon]
MYKKIIGILVCMLFVETSVLPLVEIVTSTKNTDIYENISDLQNKNSDALIGFNMNIDWDSPNIEITQFNVPDTWFTSMNPFDINVFC